MTATQNETAILERRRQVASAYLRGDYQADIAARFGISQQQVSLDLKAIRAAWLAAAVRDFDAARAQELAKIDAVEAEYWAAWEKSKKDKEVTLHEADGAKQIKKATIRREGQSGNPAYLAGILTCIERRCSILGLDAPRRFVIKWDELSDEQIDRLAKGEPPEKVLST